MSFLEKLTPAQKQQVIRLPYRVGLWISESDKDGGEEASKREQQTLSNILHGFTEDVFGAEFVQIIMSATIAEVSDWKNWQGNLEAVPEECRQVLDILRPHANQKDLDAFKRELMEIAEAVAMAFRESKSLKSPLAKFTLYFSYILARWRNRKHGQPTRSFESLLNISLHERNALNTLALALGRAYV